MKLSWLVVVVAAVLACSEVNGPSGPAPVDAAGVRLTLVASGLSNPLLLTSPPGDPRQFVIEQAGRIRVIRSGALEPEPFLDITDRVGAGGERGLLGLAFDPDFRANGRFFVHYTDKDGDSVVESYHDIDRSDRADPETGRTFLRVEQPFSNHNGGHVAFGPDGMLYIGLGDGGSGGDPLGHGQDLGSLLGTILRVDVAGRLDPPYAIPPDNPFVDDPAARPEIWHYGLRNPWRFSFDRDDGVLYIGDVGQDRWEEIDAVRVGVGGRNFGWSILEGAECFASAACEADGTALPVAVYGHDEGCSVTGGYVYRGQRIPSLRGRYLYADFCAGWIRTFRLSDAGTAVEPTVLGVDTVGAITSFGQDAQNEVYVLTANGEVFRIEPEEG